MRLQIEPRQIDGETPTREEFERAMRTAQEALNTIPQTIYRWFRNYQASGVAGTEIPGIPWDEPQKPEVVRFERVIPLEDPTSDVGEINDRLNFLLRDGEITIYEPSGLTADSEYDLLIRIVTVR